MQSIFMVFGSEWTTVNDSWHKTMPVFIIHAGQSDDIDLITGLY